MTPQKSPPRMGLKNWGIFFMRFRSRRGPLTPSKTRLENFDKVEKEPATTPEITPNKRYCSIQEIKKLVTSFSSKMDCQPKKHR
mmetsp:Transcript_6004/g.14215  ORF Transcript_6004/g.14215 Transcript_6004/m.14215 type:complete len:84 (+) Transcript_6004:990-1241(+)